MPTQGKRPPQLEYGIGEVGDDRLRPQPPSPSTKAATLVGRGARLDAADYLWRLHRGDGTTLDTDFSGEVPRASPVTLLATCGHRTSAARVADLLKLAGSTVTPVLQCWGIDGTWGRCGENYVQARRVAAPLGEAIRAAAAEVVAGDCHLANGAVLQETGRMPVHPLQVLARAYGIAPGSSRDRHGAECSARAGRHCRRAGLRRGGTNFGPRRRPQAASAGPVGPVVSLVFENRETIRFQVQEMARVEGLQTDAAVQSELDTYNTLIPEPGHLSATMFIELVSRPRWRSGCRHWSASSGRWSCASARGTAPTEWRRGAKPTRAS